MTYELELYAQALDNVSPDHFRSGDESLPPSDPRRSKIVDRFSQVNVTGRTLHKTEFAELKVRGREFVLRIVPKQLDEAGRVSPVVCVGRRPRGAADLPVWTETLIERVSGFARAAGRPLDDAALVELGAQLKEVWLTHLKKAVAIKVTAAAGGLLAVLLGLLIVFWTR